MYLELFTRAKCLHFLWVLREHAFLRQLPVFQFHPVYFLFLTQECLKISPIHKTWEFKLSLGFMHFYYLSVIKYVIICSYLLLSHLFFFLTLRQDIISFMPPTFDHIGIYDPRMGFVVAIYWKLIKMRQIVQINLIFEFHKW